MTIWDQWNTIPGWDQVQKTQKYLQATPLFQQHIHDILFKYGVDPGGQADMAGTNVDFSNDPYSIVNLLKATHTDADRATANTAANAGLEESGAAAGGINANNEDYKKNYAGAMTNLAGEISGEVGNYTGTVGGIFDDLEKAPAPAAAPPPAPGPPPDLTANAPAGGITATGTGTNTPTPQGPYIRTGPEAGGTVSAALKKVKLPVVGGRGHVT